MNKNIKEAQKQLVNDNFEKALELINDIGSDEKNYGMALTIRYASFMGLKEFDNALDCVNSLIEIYPENKWLLIDKVKCHMYVDDEKLALKTLAELEKFELDDTDIIVQISRLYRFLDDYENALRYCNMALAIDEDCTGAIYQKAALAVNMKDESLILEVCSRFEGSESDMVKILPVFFIRIFSQNFDGAYNLLLDWDSGGNEDIEKLRGLCKSLIYSQMSEELDVQLLLTGEVDLSIDEAIQLLLRYHKDGVDAGVIRNVNYIII